ncbi:tetraacyldisaccharide 4'-kinase [candidate division TA06 bacterium]|uniref:Tetraacyldisaccharide 4'-kinase n=1 Tax=candidate division TA06 bacterium TaxID=2250710 RepID=A0A933I905_UNCT6|nr:tetraacyldisaccharide 4'-kinase [candidate division TA06 bacterium]
MMTFFDFIKILLLWPFSLMYGMVLLVRRAFYLFGFAKIQQAGIPVISVGNIAAGGTGKTPFAICLSQMLMNRGLTVAVISRGYKRRVGTAGSGITVVSDGLNVKCTTAEAGDEPFLMASRLLGTKEKPGALVIVGKDRAAGAKKAVELGAQVIILDDGFQHLRLKRDLDIVLLDSQRPFDNGWLLPAGRLREPKSALRRAEVIALTRCGAEKQKAESRRRKIKNKSGKAEIFETRHRTGQPYGFVDRSAPDREMLKNTRILLFSGIARPESFEQSVRQAGLSFTTHLKYSDHHHYSQDQLKQIAGKARGYDFLFTTEKDTVRLPPDIDFGKPLFVLPVEIEFLDEDQKQKFEQIVLDKVKIK